MKKTLPKNVSSAHRKLYEDLIRLYPSHDIRLEYSAATLLERYWKRLKIHKDYQDEQLLYKAKKLHFDLYDMTANIAWEVQGIQHQKFVQFFHGDLSGLDGQKFRDRTKILVCADAHTKFVTMTTDQELNDAQIKYFYEMR